MLLHKCLQHASVISLQQTCLSMSFQIAVVDERAGGLAASNMVLAAAAL